MAATQESEMMEDIELEVQSQEEGLDSQTSTSDTDTNQGNRKKIMTEYGFVHVTVQGDQRKPAIITFHDLGLNHTTCFEGFFMFDQCQAILDNFCIYHVDAPGQEENAGSLPADYQYPTMEQLAGSILTVCEHYSLRRIIGFGVGAGGNILIRFALKHRSMMIGLILVNAVSASASWIQWGHEKLAGWYLSRSGHTNHTLQHIESYYFGEHTEENIDELQYLRSCVGKMKPVNYSKFMESYIKRSQIHIARPDPKSSKPQLTSIRCPALLMVGARSPSMDEVIDLNTRLDPTNSTFMKLEECGGLLLDEKAGAVSTAVLLFLQGLGYIINKQVKAFSSMTPVAAVTKQEEKPQEIEGDVNV